MWTGLQGGRNWGEGTEDVRFLGFLGGVGGGGVVRLEEWVKWICEDAGGEDAMFWKWKMVVGEGKGGGGGGGGGGVE